MILTFLSGCSVSCPPTGRDVLSDDTRCQRHVALTQASLRRSRFPRHDNSHRGEERGSLTAHLESRRVRDERNRDCCCRGTRECE